MLKFIIPTMTAISLCLLIVILSLTTPSTAGPFGILMVFFFVYLSSFGLMAIFLFAMSRVVGYLISFMITKKPVQYLTVRQSVFFSSVVAAAPVMLLALRSVGVVSWYGYILVLFFVFIGCLYMSRRIM